MWYENKTFRVLGSIAGIVILVAILGYTWGGPAVAAQIKAAQGSYTYNIQAKIVKISSFTTDVKDEKTGAVIGAKFKYIVTADIPESAKPIKLSNAPHILPELGPGLHAVPIPDSDLVGYIDWEHSNPTVTTSEGARIREYKLNDFVDGKLIWLSCHEGIGSSGAAELTCSEF